MSEREMLAAEMRLLKREDLADWILGARNGFSPSKYDVLIMRTFAIQLKLYEADENLLIPVRVC